MYQKHSTESHNRQAVSCLISSINKQDRLDSCSRLAEASYQLSLHNISAGIQDLCSKCLRII